MKRTALLLATIPLGAAALSSAGGCTADVRDYGDQGGGGAGGSTTDVSSSSTYGGTGGAGMCAPGDVEPCYSGPGGTQNVGVCIAGTRVCDDSGTAFGPCQGEVTPSSEVCNGADDDCNGAADDGVSCACANGGDALDFEDALGAVGDADQLTAAGSAVVSGVTFTSPNGENVFNRGKDYGNNPFSSDWFMIWTYGNGGTIDFPAPIKSLKLDAGADNAVASTGTFDIVVGGMTLQTVTLSKITTVPVDLTLPPGTTQVRIVFTSGSSSLFGFDNLEYACE